jgi:uncharacterized Zn finger protein (UPF0148 family)
MNPMEGNTICTACGSLIPTGGGTGVCPVCGRVLEPYQVERPMDAEPAVIPAVSVAPGSAAAVCSRCGAALSQAEIAFGVKMCASCTDSKVNASHPVRLVNEQIGSPTGAAQSKGLVTRRSLCVASDDRLSHTSLQGLRIEHVNPAAPDPVMTWNRSWGTQEFNATERQHTAPAAAGWHGNDLGLGLIPRLAADAGVRESMETAGLTFLWRTLAISTDRDQGLWNFAVDVPAEEVVIRCLDSIALFLLRSELAPSST